MGSSSECLASLPGLVPPPETEGVLPEQARVGHRSLDSLHLDFLHVGNGLPIECAVLALPANGVRVKARDDVGRFHLPSVLEHGGCLDDPPVVAVLGPGAL